MRSGTVARDRSIEPLAFYQSFQDLCRTSRRAGNRAQGGKEMSKEGMTVTVNGAVNVTVNGDVTLTLSTKLPREKGLEDAKEHELIRRIKENPKDDAAVEELTRRYQRMAKRVVWNHHVQPAERDFMEKVAKDAVWFAARSFDLTYERFAPYLRRVMDQRVEREINHSFLIYLPEEIRRKIWHLERFMSQNGLEESFGGIDGDRFSWTPEMKSRAMAELGVTEEELKDLIDWSLLAGVEPLLVNDPDDSGSEESRASDKSSDVVDKSVNLEEGYINKELREAVRAAVDKHCTDEEAEVLAVNFGLEDGKGLSQTNTAEELTRRHGEEVTKTDVRRVIRQALRKLKSEAPQLRGYLD